MKTRGRDENSEVREALDEDDRRYARYEAVYGPLADFLTDYEFAKGLQNLTQAGVAERMGTTQSAVSRFEAMRNPPTYHFLRRISEALGDSLFLSPLGSMCISVPYDLHDTVRSLAQTEGRTVRDLLQDSLREAMESKVTTATMGAADVGSHYRTSPTVERKSGWEEGQEITQFADSQTAVHCRGDYEDLAA